MLLLITKGMLPGFSLCRALWGPNIAISRRRFALSKTRIKLGQRKQQFADHLARAALYIALREAEERHYWREGRYNFLH